MTMRVPIDPRPSWDGAVDGSRDDVAVRFGDAARLSPYAAVIEQAKGVVMARYVVNADTAFEMIRKWSRDGNVKVRDVAAHLVETATCHDADRDVLGLATPTRITLDEALDAIARAAARHHAEQTRPLPPT